MKQNMVSSEAEAFEVPFASTSSVTLIWQMPRGGYWRARTWWGRCCRCGCVASYYKVTRLVVVLSKSLVLESRRSFLTGSRVLWGVLAFLQTGASRSEL